MSRSGTASGSAIRHDPRLGLVVGHSGGLPGYGSHMRWIPDRGIGVIGLANVTYGGMGAACAEALDVLADLDELPPARVLAAPRARRRPPIGPRRCCRTGATTTPRCSSPTTSRSTSRSRGGGARPRRWSPATAGSRWASSEPDTPLRGTFTAAGGRGRGRPRTEHTGAVQWLDVTDHAEPSDEPIVLDARLAGRGRRHGVRRRLRRPARWPSRSTDGRGAVLDRLDGAAAAVPAAHVTMKAFGSVGRAGDVRGGADALARGGRGVGRRDAAPRAARHGPRAVRRGRRRAVPVVAARHRGSCDPRCATSGPPAEGLPGRAPTRSALDAWIAHLSLAYPSAEVPARPGPSSRRGWRTVDGAGRLRRGACRAARLRRRAGTPRRPLGRWRRLDAELAHQLGHREFRVAVRAGPRLEGPERRSRRGRRTTTSAARTRSSPSRSVSSSKRAARASAPPTGSAAIAVGVVAQQRRHVERALADERARVDGDVAVAPADGRCRGAGRRAAAPARRGSRTGRAPGDRLVDQLAREGPSGEVVAGRHRPHPLARLLVDGAEAVRVRGSTARSRTPAAEPERGRPRRRVSAERVARDRTVEQHAPPAGRGRSAPRRPRRPSASARRRGRGTTRRGSTSCRVTGRSPARIGRHGVGVRARGRPRRPARAPSARGARRARRGAASAHAAAAPPRLAEAPIQERPERVGRHGVRRRTRSPHGPSPRDATTDGYARGGGRADRGQDGRSRVDLLLDHRRGSPPPHAVRRGGGHPPGRSVVVRRARRRRPVPGDEPVGGRSAPDGARGSRGRVRAREHRMPGDARPCQRRTGDRHLLHRLGARRRSGGARDGEPQPDAAARTFTPRTCGPPSPRRSTSAGAVRGARASRARSRSAAASTPSPSRWWKKRANRSWSPARRRRSRGPVRS